MSDKNPKFQLHLSIGDNVKWKEVGKEHSKGFRVYRGRVISCDLSYADPNDNVCIQALSSSKGIVFVKRSELEKDDDDE